MFRHSISDHLRRATSPRIPGIGRTALASLSLVVLAAGGMANAATIHVTTTDQKISGTGGCSLQEAIWAANLGASKAVHVDVNDNIVHIDTECELQDDGSASYTLVVEAGSVFQMSNIIDDPFNYMGPAATPIILVDIVIEAGGSRFEHVPNGIDFRAFAVGVWSFASGVPIATGAGHLVLRNAHVKGFTARGGNGTDGGGGGLGAGGAIYVHGGGLTVERSTFEGNGAFGGNGSRSVVNMTGGGGGGLGGNGGRAGRVEVLFGAGAGGGGGARGDGGNGTSSGLAGGSGGGTLRAGSSSELGDESVGGFRCGGRGGYVTLNPFNSPKHGEEPRAPCAGGGGGGGRDAFPTFLETVAGNGGRGNYGGGGGGGSGAPVAGDGGDGGFGGGGGSTYPSPNPPPFLCSPNGGNGGFGGGGGAAPGGLACPVDSGPGRAGSFAGNAGPRDAGGGAGLGGAIFNHSGHVVVRNSTFTGNRAVRGVAGNWPNNEPESHSGQDQGAAIFSVGGSLSVLNSTISGNLGTSSINGGAGIVVYAPGPDIFSPTTDQTTRFELRNSIIAGNDAGSAVVKECRLINSSSNSVQFQGSGNLITANDNCTQGLVSSTDPLLGPLTLNAPGLTPTMAPGAGSAAIDAADSGTALDTDQRGVTRPIGMGFDIGAYEWGAVVAKCRNVTASAGASCQAHASIDDGSNAPDGGDFSLSQDPPGPYGLGATLVLLTVTHESGAFDFCEATVTVEDDLAPVVMPTLSIASLSPTRQHNLVNVGLGATATDECSTPPASFQVEVYGDEDDEAPTDGTTVFSPDASDLAIDTLRLRAERDDADDGRVYLVVVSGADSAGNTGYGCATVVVPHNSSVGSSARVALQADAARTHCEASSGMPPAGYFVIGDGPSIGPKPKK
jgi:hypothetical protein